MSSERRTRVVMIHCNATVLSTFILLQRVHGSLKGIITLVCCWIKCYKQSFPSSAPQSSTVGDIQRAILPLFDRRACESDSKLMEAASKMMENDSLEPTAIGWYFCNNDGYAGYPLEPKRIDAWKKARVGTYIWIRSK
jgi:hypothetical protein